MTRKYDVTGMSCAACSARIEKVVGKLEGVKSVTVNLLMNNMTVDFDENTLNDDKIIQAVIGAGYGASLPREENTPQTTAEKTVNPADEELASMKTRLVWSIVFLVPLMYVAMGHMLHLPMPSWLHGEGNYLTNALVQLLLCVPVLFLNRKFYVVGLKALWKRSPNMDSLIAVGSGAALVSGLVAVFRMSYGYGHGDLAIVERYAHNLYIESAAMILTLITVGKFLETRSKGRTGQAISRLIALTPDTAKLLKNGVEVETPVAQVQLGDIAVVRAGDRVPVDGVICHGNAAIDQSALCEALNSGHLGGAALDVMVPEPLTGDDPLWNAKNVILTPHVSGSMNLPYTCDLTVAQFCRNLERYAAGEALSGVVDRTAGY